MSYKVVAFGPNPLQVNLLADVFWHSILVYHEVHGLVSNESLGHVPNAFVLAAFAPRVLKKVSCNARSSSMKLSYFVFFASCFY